MSLDTLPRARTRDGFLDLLRGVARGRGGVIHIIGHAKFWFWPAPTYVAPGMPMVFFVSGSLAYKSLRAVDGVRRSVPEYWRKTYRRLLLPYWTYYGVLSALSVIGDLTHTSAYWDVNYRRLLLGATGLIIPDASRPMRHHTGHVWFMAVFLVLALFAPAMVRLFEKARWLLLAAVLGIFAWVQYLVIERGVVFEYEVEKLTTFAVPYVVGFWYTDGGLRKATRGTLVAVAAALAAGAWYWNGVEPGAVNGSQPKHLLVGGAWLFAALAAAPVLQKFAAKHSAVLDRVNKRSFTAYLWGWTTCVFAADWVDELIDPGWLNRLLMSVGSLVFLGVVIALFGRVEDVSARRPTRRTGELQPAAG